MGSPFPTVNCTKCVEGYTNDISRGNCTRCPDNCVACYCVPYYSKVTDPCYSTACSECAPGYYVSEGKCIKYASQKILANIAVEEDNVE